MPGLTRDRWLAQSDGELLADCDVDRFRGSGPGGQKRNKTSSAVRLRHRPSGLAAHATESRSQHQNKARALRRLRARMALELRGEPSEAGRAAAATLVAGPPRSERARREVSYLIALAALIDELAAADFAVGAAAAALGVGSGALSRVIAGDPAALRQVNQERTQRGLRPLH